MPETSIPPPAPIPRAAKPVSEALLNEKVCLAPATFCFAFLIWLGIYWEGVDWMGCNGLNKLETMLTTPVGPLPLLPPNPLITRPFLRRRFLSPHLQAPSVACVCWIGLWCRTGV
jgi:hypothetical protein